MHVFPRQVKWKEDEVGGGEKKEERKRQRHRGSAGEAEGRLCLSGSGFGLRYY